MERKRHDELKQIRQELDEILDTALNYLMDIWDEIGINGDSREDRTKVVAKHVRDLLAEMVEDETKLKSQLIIRVKTREKKLDELCEELDEEPPELPHGLSMLHRDKKLKAEIDKLNKEKDWRMKRLKDLRKDDKELCEILFRTPYYIPTGTVPTLDQLRDLERHVKTQEEEKERRTRQFLSDKSNIVKLLEELEQDPDTSFEKEILCEPEESFLLTEENFKKLQNLKEELEGKMQENFSEAKILRERMETLWGRLQISESDQAVFNARCAGFRPKTIKSLKTEIERCEELVMANIKEVIEAARRELDEWWDKCYFSQQQREEFKAYHSDQFSEELLELFDKEVQKMKEHYKKFQTLFEKVAERQKLWAEYLVFERKAADPNRFFNRGCGLLKEEKARKKLMKDLPRVEQEVAEYIEAWEKNEGQDFLVEGVRFLDYIKSQWANYKNQKENEKQQRLQAREKERAEEMLYGSRPVTPAKRGLVNGTTPSRTPKQRKLHETPGRKTPMSASRLGKSVNHTSVFMSPYSGPKSASKSTKSRTPHHGTRKALGERNGTNDTIFSQTTMSGFGGSVQSLHTQPDTSLASVGGYNEFAVSIPLNSTFLGDPGVPLLLRCTPSSSSSAQSTQNQIGLNSTQKMNCRSSVVPRSRPAYF